LLVIFHHFVSGWKWSQLDRTADAGDFQFFAPSFGGGSLIGPQPVASISATASNTNACQTNTASILIIRFVVITLGLCLSQTMVFPLLKAKSLEIDAEKKIATATPSGCKEKFREKKVRTG
jgi:hypothetical protein